MSNTADKEAYLKKKQELLEELKKRKKQIIFQLKEKYEQRKKVIPKNEAEKGVTSFSFQLQKNFFCLQLLNLNRWQISISQ